jgi:uncharacterized protein (DUF983 family)
MGTTVPSPDGEPASTGPSAGPSRAKLLFRGMTRRCPVCGEPRIFAGYFRLRPACPGCGLRFTRLEGQWSGDIGINTIVTFGLLYVILLGGTLLMWGDVNIALLAGAALLAVLVFPVLFVPVAKTLWLAIDLVMRPPQADEFDGEHHRGAVTGH